MYYNYYYKQLHVIIPIKQDVLNNDSARMSFINKHTTIDVYVYQ